MPAKITKGYVEKPVCVLGYEIGTYITVGFSDMHTDDDDMHVDDDDEDNVYIGFIPNDKGHNLFSLELTSAINEANNTLGSRALWLLVINYITGSVTFDMASNNETNVDTDITQNDVD